jgi:hypothetical protein
MNIKEVALGGVAKAGVEAPASSSVDSAESEPEGLRDLLIAGFLAASTGAAVDEADFADLVEVLFAVRFLALSVSAPTLPSRLGFFSALVFAGALPDDFATGLALARALAFDGVDVVDSVSETGLVESVFFTISGALQAANGWATRTSQKA